MAERVPPEVQHYAVKYQQLQNLLAQILAEKSAVETELREINRVLSELEKLPDDVEIYKSIGHVLVRTSKADVKKELDEKKELLELRLKALEKQEKEARRQLEEVQAKIKEVLSKSYQLAEKALKGQAG